jgi:hypothetical protein
LRRGAVERKPASRGAHEHQNSFIPTLLRRNGFCYSQRLDQQFTAA